MKQRKKIAVVLAITAVIACVAGMSEKMSPVILAENHLKRNENGEGSYEEELQLTVDGVMDAYSYTVTVPEQKLTKEEEQNALQAAWEEIEAEFPGENEGLDCIRKRVEIRDSYQDGRVKAEWNFDDYKIMDVEGNVTGQDLPEEGRLVGAEVELFCGSSAVCKDFCFQVFPDILTEEEKVLAFVEESLLAQEQKAGEEAFTLPEKMGKQELIWQAAKTYLPLKIGLLGIFIAGMIPYIEKSREREMQKKREQELAMEYPDVVSKLSILLSAGMTLQRAWEKIAFSYEEKRKRNEIRRMPAYEEMLMVCHELESGRGEERAYERFGERCGLSSYRKLGNMLAQNVRKGNRGIVELLEKEAENSFEQRKQMAKRCGEEAATKLLFPMFLMFGMIVVILIVPAAAAFRI